MPRAYIQLQRSWSQTWSHISYTSESYTISSAAANHSLHALRSQNILSYTVTCSQEKGKYAPHATDASYTVTVEFEKGKSKYERCNWALTQLETSVFLDVYSRRPVSRYKLKINDYHTE